MSAPATRAGRRDAQRRGRPAFVALNGAFLNVAFLVGAVAAWPIYRSAAFVIMVAVALVAANGLALAGARWRLSGWWVALGGLGVYLLAGVPVAVPSALGGIEQLGAGWVQLATAPVTGWKELLTVSVPVGSYQATLAPAFLLFLGIPLAALSLAWRAPRLWVLAAPLALVLPAFGVLFGSSLLSDALVIGSASLPGPWEIGVGAASVAVLLGWLVWRAGDERRRAILVAAQDSGVRVTSRGRATFARRVAIGGVMLVVAIGAAVVVAPVALAGEDRDVLRTRVDPLLRIHQELSPLTSYREYFSDELYDEVLFEVSTEGAEVDRVRLATLSSFDGRLARVTDPDAPQGDQSTAFTRVPSVLDPPTDGEEATAAVAIAGYSGIWVPTVGDLTSLAFDGAERSALADGFYYNQASRTGVELADGGLSAGASYRQSAVVAQDGRSLSELDPPTDGPSLPEELVPQSLRDWVRAQEAPSGGAGLAQLVDRLRARGFLSHALTVDEAAPPQWMTELGDYVFEPSRAGHSSDRIDRLFLDLLEKQAQVGGADDASLVAAAGDDEQFAVAAALVADQLGFPARVVLGARLVEPEQAVTGVPACADGVCRGANMTAWIEVQDEDGSWHAVDVTPQHENGLAPQVDRQRDPQNVTDVDPQRAQTVLPPQSQPAEGDGQEQPTQETPLDLGWLWSTLRIAGVSLLVLVVLAAPFLVVLIAKATRRRSRRRAEDPVERVVGGWDEYVDSAMDHGLPAPRSETRTELAELYSVDEGAAGALTLADWADRSVFAPSAPDAAESEAFWRLVDAERERFDRGAGWWERVKARLSLRSFARHLRSAPRPGTGPRRR